MRSLLIFLLLSIIAVAGEPKRLSVRDLGFDFILTGLAGIPLGQFFEIEATAVQDQERSVPKDDRYNMLRVTSVNGRKLEKPEEIHILGDYRVPQGIVFRLTVVEDAQFEFSAPPNLSPQDYFSGESSKLAMQHMWTGLRIIKQIAPATPELKQGQRK